jgi:hypothetical protein
LFAGQSLSIGQAIRSCDGQYVLTLQADGNLVEYGPAGAIWSTVTGPINRPGPKVGYGARGVVATMQGDGNLVLYNAQGKAAWNSKTYGFPGAALRLQADSNLVVYTGNTALWSWMTGNLVGRK